MSEPRKTDIEIGDRVRYKGTGEVGTVVDIKWFDPIAWDVYFTPDDHEGTTFRYFETGFEKLDDEPGDESGDTNEEV